MKKYFGIIVLISSFSVFAEIEDNCLEKAETQLEINNCIGLNYLSVKNELERVLADIKSAYKDDMLFLEKLESSQAAWLIQFKLDLEMKFPLEDKQTQYGSVYPMCQSDFKTKLVLSRIKFLKEWLRGFNKGDVCKGLVKIKE